MERNLKIDISENNAFFLWGARKTGKTTFAKLIAITFDDSKRVIDKQIEVFPWYDFLKEMWNNKLFCQPLSPSIPQSFNPSILCRSVG